MEKDNKVLFATSIIVIVLIVALTAIITNGNSVSNSDMNLAGKAYMQVGLGCGDGYCSPTENRGGNCPADCSSQTNTCGNGICEDGEATMCPVCQGDVCPDMLCVAGTCDRDCRLNERVPKNVCGNGICEDGEATMCPICDGNICPDMLCTAGTCDQDCLSEYRERYR